MKKIFILSTLLFATMMLARPGFAQREYTASLDIELAKVKDDTSRVLILADLAFYHRFQNLDTGRASQGTGLGLSLSYDIVKAHGGELKVETKEGEGSEFVIQIPDR